MYGFVTVFLQQISARSSLNQSFKEYSTINVTLQSAEYLFSSQAFNLLTWTNIK